MQPGEVIEGTQCKGSEMRTNLAVGEMKRRPVCLEQRGKRREWYELMLERQTWAKLWQAL